MPDGGEAGAGADQQRNQQPGGQPGYDAARDGAERERQVEEDERDGDEVEVLVRSPHAPPPLGRAHLALHRR